MRVVLVAQPIDSVVPPVQNSVGVCTWELAQALSVEHEVCVITAHAGRRREELRVDRLHVVLLPRRVPDRLLRLVLRLRSRLTAHGMLSPRPTSTSAWLYPCYGRTVRQELRRLSPEVVHLQHATQYACGIRSAVPHAALVLQAHAEWLPQTPQRVLAHRLKAVDLVATVSEYLRARVLASFPELHGRVLTVRDGATLSADLVRKDSAMPRDRRDQEQVILFVGAVTPHKGVHDLVDAFVRLAPRFTAARLQVVGPIGAWPMEETFAQGDTTWLPCLRKFYLGDYGQTLLARIPPHLRDRVEFTGYLPRTEVLARMSSAAVFAFPSINDEGFGLPPVEAMAAGLPVVVTRSGALTETVSDGVTGVVVEKGRPDQLAEAIEGLLADRELARTMGQAARQCVAEMFTWTHAAHSAAAAYELAIARRPPPVHQSAGPLSSRFGRAFGRHLPVTAAGNGRVAALSLSLPQRPVVFGGGHEEGFCPALAEEPVRRSVPGQRKQGF